MCQSNNFKRNKNITLAKKLLSRDTPYDMSSMHSIIQNISALRTITI